MVETDVQRGLQRLAEKDPSISADGPLHEQAYQAARQTVGRVHYDTFNIYFYESINAREVERHGSDGVLVGTES